jgi:hypothetical protein
MSLKQLSSGIDDQKMTVSSKGTQNVLRYAPQDETLINDISSHLRDVSIFLSNRMQN